MSEETAVSAAEPTPSPAPTAKKSPPKPKRNPTPKAAAGKKTEPKTMPKPNGKPGKKELNGPQLRVLRILAKAFPKGLPRKAIVERSEKDGHGTRLDIAWMTEWIGSLDPVVRAKNDAKRFPSLLTRGFVKVETVDDKGKDVVVQTITAAGKKAVEDAKKAGK